MNGIVAADRLSIILRLRRIMAEEQNPDVRRGLEIAILELKTYKDSDEATD